MHKFVFPADLTFNRAPIENPTAYARERGAASWLFLVGEEFASMPGGMSFDQVEEAVALSERVISDPPRVLNLDLARQHIRALDALPRPTIISCRSGPRASAVAYMYSGLKQGAPYEEVLAAAQADAAPFCAFPDYCEWVRSAMESLAVEED